MGLINKHNTPLGIGRYRIGREAGLPEGPYTSSEEQIIALFKSKGFLVEEGESPVVETPAEEAPVVETPAEEEEKPAPKRRRRKTASAE